MPDCICGGGLENHYVNFGGETDMKCDCREDCNCGLYRLPSESETEALHLAAISKRIFEENTTRYWSENLTYGKSSL